jgi:hypothetical protein
VFSIRDPLRWLAQQLSRHFLLLLGAEVLVLVIDRLGWRLVDGAGLMDGDRLISSIGPALRVYSLAVIPSVFLYLGIYRLAYPLLRRRLNLRRVFAVAVSPLAIAVLGFTDARVFAALLFLAVNGIWAYMIRFRDETELSP